MYKLFPLLLLLLMLPFSVALATPLSDTVKKVKPAVVGVGVYDPTGRPQNQLWGTGFVIGDGRYVVTNHHVIDGAVKASDNQQQVVFIGSGQAVDIRPAKVVAFSREHDLAILAIRGNSLPALKLASLALQTEGNTIAFTGFPIGASLGLYPATHRGIISAITPVVIPSNSSTKLTPAMIKRLKNPYLVYQLDAVAYPGNSGSPVYLQDSGEVIAIVNKVFVKKTKEAALSSPSGITYAIPVKYLYQLIEQARIDI
ncbi:serine protease [Thalassotalea maritima]|uniref:S1 family peptidase n=1 Tax=Thalassotalea maritima TaxID=3242416 RepID=UPI0035276391